MTTVDATNPFYQNSAGSVTSSNNSGGMLAQQDFLTLLTTQLQNQDPLSPMDNAEFLSQMAQFSAVEGIQNVEDSINNLATTMGATQVQTAASLLGHSVLVPGNLARADANGEVHGMAELETGVSSISITFTDAETDTLLYTQTLGAHSEGLVDFEWTDLPAELAANRGQVRVAATAETENGTVALATSVYAPVRSAIGGPSSPSITLMVEDYGALDTLEVSAFR